MTDKTQELIERRKRCKSASLPEFFHNPEFGVAAQIKDLDIAIDLLTAQADEIKRLREGLKFIYTNSHSMSNDKLENIAEQLLNNEGK